MLNYMAVISNRPEESIYRELQRISGDPTAVVDRHELAAALSGPRREVSARRIATLINEQLIPQSVRVGSGRGVWPVAVIDLANWVLDRQEAGISNSAISELVPLWSVLHRSLVAGEVDLAEIENVARSRITDVEANNAIPMLVSSVVSWLVPEDRGCLTWRLKNGVVRTGEDAVSFCITFLLTEPDEESGVARPTSFAQLRLPGFDVPDFGGADVIILGSPPDMPVLYENIRQFSPKRRSGRSAGPKAEALFAASVGA
jgi:hypothetical protein